MSEAPTPQGNKPGRRRPREEDTDDLLARVESGTALNEAARQMGIDPPSAHHWMYADETRRQRFLRACEMRQDVQAEQLDSLGMAAALGREIEIEPGVKRKVDANGLRVLADIRKWNSARMGLGRTGGVHRVQVLGPDDNIDDKELDAKIAALALDVMGSDDLDDDGEE